MHITQGQADEILCDDLKQFEKVVEEAMTVLLTNCQFAALVSCLLYRSYTSF
ncbi:glycoside hydrolase family protein [Bartonella silvatica]|uniref:glycoside hydrolase family protein n=1 Tax=Bartonella silvatica TaxID=357760 RepID=UPI003F4964DB